MPLILLAIIYIVALAIIIHLIKITYKTNKIYGGVFDINKYLIGLKNIEEHIEVEIKLKDLDMINKIIKWVNIQTNIIKENTINNIWTKYQIIKITNGNDITWHTKKKLTNIMMPEISGKMTVSIEKPITKPEIQEPPDIIRKKNRTSIKLNKYWRLDVTYVNDNDIPEIEIEYIAKDFYNAGKRINYIQKFIKNLI